MLSDKTLIKGDWEKLQFVRWVLFLITAAEAAGIPVLTRSRLHALLFMSFSSARFYRLKPLRQRAQRTDHGPYYRAAHLALGHLVFSDLVDVDSFKAHPSPKDLQFEGTFKITKNGLNVCRKLRGTDTGERLYKFLLDMCLGAAKVLYEESIEQDAESGIFDAMLSRDLTYVAAMKRSSPSLIIEEQPGDVTPTLSGLRSIDTYLRDRMFVNRKDVLTAYQTLLQNRAKVVYE
jgi:hypothetical protein